MNKKNIKKKETTIGIMADDDNEHETCCDVHCSLGPRGPRGFQGVLGQCGRQGERGTQGPAPSDAERGQQGPVGFSGTLGMQGSRGVWGIIIDTNALGFQGIGGSLVVGPQGLGGERGTQGFDSDIANEPGPQGEQGYDGDDGAQGRIGAIGNVGPMSDITRGYQGIDGMKGMIGPESAVTNGPQGDQGPQGSEGTSQDGSVGLQGFQGRLSQIGGSQGFLGTQGAMGINGKDGQVGFQGDVGYVGAQGPDGAMIQTIDSLTWVPQTAARFLNDTPLQTFTSVPMMALDTIPNQRYVLLCNFTVSSSENLATATVRDEFKTVLATTTFTITGTWQTVSMLDTFLAVGSRCLLFLDIPALLTAANFSVIQVL